MTKGQWAGDMAQWVGYLLCMHSDLTFLSQGPEIPGVSVGVPVTSVGRSFRNGFLGQVRNNVWLCLKGDSSVMTVVTILSVTLKSGDKDLWSGSWCRLHLLGPPS